MNLKELSQLLNLSQTTVSRALNGYPEVNEGTRQRVMRAAKEHGYQPNAAARRLATGKANAIGCVTIADDVGMSPQFMEFLAGVSAQAGKARLDVVLASAEQGDEEAAYRRLASHGQVDAIFLFAPRRNDARIALLQELDLPFITYGRAPGVGLEHPALDADIETAFHNAARLLVQLGHKQIALLAGPKGRSSSAQQEGGARRALKDAGVEFPRGAVASGELTEQRGYESARQLLQSGAPPSAILCGDIFVAKGVDRATRELGLEIGADLSLIAHDDGFAYLDPETFETPLTTTRAPLREAGMRVAERLNKRIKGVEKEQKVEVWPVELIVRASIGPPKA